MVGVARRGFRAMGAAGLAVAALPAVPASAQTAREAELEARLKLLEQAVEDLRAELRSRPATAAAVPAATAPPATASQGVVPGTAAGASTASPAIAAQSGTGKPGRRAESSVGALAAAPSTDGFRIGATTVKLGGFVRLNVIGSRYNDGEVAVGGLGKEFFLPQQIPVGGGFSSEDLLFSARQTRLVVSTATPVNGIDAKTLVEFDFALATAPVGAQRATNPYVPTFRRGFIEYGPLLVGQEWSTFQNIGVLPETTDFVGPLDGTVFNRQALVRYSRPLSKAVTLQLALENPETQTALPTNPALVDTDDDNVPDAVARLNWRSGLGEFALAGIARQLRTETLGVGDTAFGWGLSGSGKVPLGKLSDLRFMVTYGEGIGRYLGLGYVPDAIYGGAVGNRLRTITNVAAFAAIKIGWSPTVRSTFMGSYQDADYPRGFVLTGLANEKSYGGAANLFWSPGKGFDLGLEYRHAIRELTSGDSGALDRIEFAFKYGF